MLDVNVVEPNAQRIYHKLNHVCKMHPIPFAIPSSKPNRDFRESLPEANQAPVLAQPVKHAIV
jgi:hypothetical protein